jgi:AraC family transcriptional regulator of adaptative response / DNA-3-methyladenine glycosylase II
MPHPNRSFAFDIPVSIKHLMTASCCDGIGGFPVGALRRAHLSRDPRFDGTFFVGVASMSVYCRPICDVRHPKPGNIRYFETAAAALAAGLRPCLRCRPESAPGGPHQPETSVVLRRVLRLIDDGALDSDSVRVLAARVGLGTRHLDRLFARHVGASPITVAQVRRLQFAKSLIDETRLPMTDIAVAAGFGSLRRFNATFQEVYGRAPRELRKDRGPTPSSQDVTLRLAYQPPYDWNQVHEFLAARAVPGIERVDGCAYTRTVQTAAGHAIVSVRPVEGEHALELRATDVPPAELFKVVLTVRRAFDLNGDPMRVVEALRIDRLLAPLVKRHPGLRIVGAWSPFECTVRAVIGEDISLTVARALTARLISRAGRRIEDAVEGLTHLFPSPAALAHVDLQGLGLTETRVTSLRALARAVTRRTIDFTTAPEQIIDALAELRGIGTSTVECVALRALGEPDAFPTDDRVLRHVAETRGGLFERRTLNARAEAWRPWRGYAAFHLWRAADHQDRLTSHAHEQIGRLTGLRRQSTPT